MVTAQEVDRQLEAAGVKRSFIIHAEIKELRQVLVPGEQVQYCVWGRYEGGFAMLCATDQRVLLIDKKPMFLTMEDIRYDMVSEVDFSARLIDSSLRICTPNKDLRFRSFSGKTLRCMSSYVQHRIMEFRQQHMMPYSPDQETAAQQALILQHPLDQEQGQELVQGQQQPQLQPMQPTAIELAPFVPSNHYIQTDLPQQPQQMAVGTQDKPNLATVNSLSHQVVNPYLRVPLMMRRRTSRFPSL